MQQSRRRHLVMLSATLAAPLLPAQLQAAPIVHPIDMLNVDPEDRRSRMLFKPAILRIQAGDGAKFGAADRGHNAQSIDGMIPEGAEPFRGRINEEIEVTFDVQGTYGYICQPHATMGMIGFVLVGDFTGNLEAVRTAGARLRGRDTTRRFGDYMAAIDAIAADEGLT